MAKYRFYRQGFRAVRHAAIALTVAALTAAGALAGNPASDGKLKVYFIDVEGGQSTLFVTPEGRSLLIDTGWPGNNGRDADRIAAAAHRAGVSRINLVIITHYHTDHVGGVPQLLQRIPVDAFMDHGPNRELDHGITEQGAAAYGQAVTASHASHVTAHPGDVIDFGELQGRVISADGELLAQPLPGAGQPNPACAASTPRPADQTENARSLGVEFHFGKLTLLDLGDLTWDKEMQLMCPNNRLGHADVYIVSHHGWYQSSSPALVQALGARVAIMDNGETKGGSVPTFQTLRAANGLQALWQLHYSGEGGAQYNRPAEYIANLKGTDPGNYLLLTGERNGGFKVTNSRTGQSKSYTAP